MGMTDAIADYSYLVKKISFRVSLLPVIRLLSALRVHVFFLTMFSIVLVLYHHFPELIWFQVVYYTFALSFLLFSVGLLLSALSVMLRDFSRLVGVMLQVLFWYTPVVWNSEEISASALYIFRINPLFYIVQGYRDTCIDHIWVWDKPVQNVMFWMICMICLWSAAVIFHRCRPHFADLL